VQQKHYLNLWEAIGLLAFSDPSDIAGETWRDREITAGRDRADVYAEEMARVEAVLDALRGAAIDGGVIVSGRRSGDATYRPIPTIDWSHLEIDPIGGSDGTGAAIPASLPEDNLPPGFPPKRCRAVKEWIDLRFRRAQIKSLPPVSPDDPIMRCAEWMRSRRADRGDEKKDTLSKEAPPALGLTVRQFNAAYKAVYQRRRGHPRRA
jgi:hypothetical protein